MCIRDSDICISEDGKENKVGSKGADPPNDIELSGLEIEQNHCTVSNNGGKKSISVGNK